MTTTPDETSTVGTDDDELTLEEFCQWMVESTLEQFATWWTAEQAKQPDIFDSEMAAGEWITQFLDWWEGTNVDAPPNDGTVPTD